MLLQVDDLHVQLPSARGSVAAVRGISLSLDRNQVHCLVGESGCGKTMTAMAIIGLLPRGAQRRATRLDFDGIDLREPGEARMRTLRGRRIAMIFQDPMTALNPSFTIETQLTDVLKHHERIGHSAARDRAVYLLGRVGIRDPLARLRQYPHELSGGLRQRVMIAMALMCQPELLLADEPTTALDVTIQMEVLSLLAELGSEFHLALLLVSHDLGVVSQVADWISVMYAGEIVESGAAADVIDSPLHPYTQGLLRCVPYPGRTQRQTALYTIPGGVDAIEGHPNQCAFVDRCEFAHPGCRAAAIPLRSCGPSRVFRCNLEPEQLRRAVKDEASA
ncbi:MAG: ABC transporter ATP-binding protein [Betaproteobacteria bacterium]|nr:ABC transporter ATP-binding protein [Betaproteobacteria bacterium]